MKEKIIAYLKYYVRSYGASVAMMFLTIILTLSLATFHVHDESFFYHATGGQAYNILGYFGSTLAALFVYVFGSVAYLIPLVMVYQLMFMLGVKKIDQELDQVVGVYSSIILLSGVCCYHHLGLQEFSGAGGVLGAGVMYLLSSFDGLTAGIVLYTLLLATSILAFRFIHFKIARALFVACRWFGHYVMQVDNMPARIVRGFASGVAAICVGFYRAGLWAYNLLLGSVVRRSDLSIIAFEKDENSVDQNIDHMLQDLFGKQEALEKLDERIAQAQKDRAHKELAPKQQESFVAVSKKAMEEEVEVAKTYQLPDIEKMLDRGNYSGHQEISKSQLAEQSAILEEKLSLFSIKGKVVRVHPGPVITLFEYKPDDRIKLSKIIGLEDDLAMALQALSIRIIAPIPGKDVVGFEVANKVRTPVLLSNIFHSSAWTKFKGSLPIILGEDTYGNHIVVDLAAMPHLLIAGSTGSGKSVGVNCMLVSLLCAKNPEELKLIIIDPKQIEFTAYEKVAHLLFPVITDPKKAVPVLKWVVMTMEQRYEQMAVAGVKNIFEYQKALKNRGDLEPMPFIVVIIDELADLMMTTGKDAEGLIARIAQMSRAAGIHMIVATQRPSVDVITGLIKVNFPNRISFKVTSKIDSRTILDESGAERLLGKGDMLFIDSKEPHIRRVHGAYVSEQEVQYLVQHIQTQQAPKFLDVADMFVSEADDSALFETDQELFVQVVDMLKDVDEISISLIQRRFRIGYNRSARIMETLEARGLILPSDGSKMRRVLKD